MVKGPESKNLYVHGYTIPLHSADSVKNPVVCLPWYFLDHDYSAEVPAGQPDILTTGEPSCKKKIHMNCSCCDSPEFFPVQAKSLFTKKPGRVFDSTTGSI